MWIIATDLVICLVMNPSNEPEGQMYPHEEAQFEITSSNVEQILDHQMAKAQGLVEFDHPAIAASKASYR